MAELKENTLAEEEVVKLVELKCIKLRQDFLFKFNATDTNNYPRPKTSLCIENHPREELEERMLGLEEGKERGESRGDWKEVRE